MGKENIDVELPNEILFKLMLMAHEEDITLNQLCENILREQINKMTKKVCIAELEDDEIFDKVFEDVEINKVMYTIYEDKDYTIAKAVIIPYSDDSKKAQN